MSQLEKMLLFAYKNKLTFVPNQDIARKAKLIEDTGHCPCKEERPECPCSECLKEIESDGKCFCWVFTTYKEGYEYLKSFGYIKE